MKTLTRFFVGFFGVAILFTSISCARSEAKPNVTTKAQPTIQSRWSGHGDIHFSDSKAAQPGYTPAQIRHAYGIDQITATGAGQVVAIIDAVGSPTLQSDLQVFSQTYGLPAANLQIIYPGGQPPTQDSGWAVETTLDVEWVHAIAPDAKIILLATPSANGSDLTDGLSYLLSNAASLGVSQVSMSWGGGETSDEVSNDTLFNAAGVTYVASSGDNGTGVMWPASSPKVLAVGGTSLSLTGSGTISSETAWSGSGGGESQYFSTPAYQQGFDSSGQRGVPDVSFVADPNTGVSIYVNGAWNSVGGTSIGAPQWTALIAIINSTRTTPLGDLHAAIYSLATASQLTTYFNDITSGCNGRGSTALDCAQVGYDYVTGLGTPKASVLAAALKSPPPPPPPPDGVANTPTFNGQTQLTVNNPFQAVTFAFDVSNFPTASSVYYEAIGPNINFSQANGVTPDAHHIIAGSAPNSKGSYQLIPIQNLPQGWGTYYFRVIPLDSTGQKAVGIFSNAAVINVKQQ